MKYPIVVFILVLLGVSNPTSAELQICFWSDREDGTHSLFAMNRDGTAPFNLTKELGFRRKPQLSPDGTRVVFESVGPVTSRGEIFVMNADGSNRVNVTNGAGSDRQPRWSPDGSQILWHGWPPDRRPPEVFVADADGSNRRSLGRGIWPHWSPDGSMIGFTVTGLPEIASIMNADGSGRRKVTDHVINTRFLSWSPDGSTVAFSNHHLNNDVQVYVVNVDGTDLVSLTEALMIVDSLSPDWSPDGTRIAFAAMLDIFVVNVDGTRLVNITEQHPPGRSLYPAWSPDGAEIVFQTDRDGNREIYVMDADGSNPVNLTNHPADDGAPSWFRFDTNLLTSVPMPRKALITTWGQIKAVSSER